MAKHTLYAILITLSLSYTTSFAATVDWWEDASLYQIYPRSWKDSDGNGIGDLKGITENLNYLKDIGMTATWLSPIYKSPMADNGYDISNFTDIDPIFGTLEDFDGLMKKSKEIGLKIILDFVPNHSSDKCEWFLKSINREDGYEDFYVWADGLDDPKNSGKKLPPSNWVSIFDGSMWTWNEKRQQFYMHQFLPQQPEINFKSKKVHQKMLDVLKFWLDRGVDGFRIDAVAFFFEKINEDGSYPDQDPNSHYYTQDQDENPQLLYEWREFLDSYQKQNGGDTRVMLAEAYSAVDILDKYIGDGINKGSQVPFNFELLNLNKTSNARDVKNLIDAWMNVIWKKHQTANWVTGNHDRIRISNRVGQNKTGLLYFLTTALPGVTVVYYGEEIGMSNVITCQNCPLALSRNFARTPFQWNDDVSAGFSSSNKTWLPVSEDYKTVNVKNQLASTRSPLKVFKALQKLKTTTAFKAFKDADGFSYDAVNDNVFIIIRHSSNEEYIFLINWGENEEEIGELVTSQYAKNSLMEYVVITENSPHTVGDKVMLSDILLIPLEAVALKRVLNF